MANNIFNNFEIAYNSIADQKLTAANTLTIKAWNDIITILKTQANVNAKYLTSLNKWLIGDNEVSIPGENSFVEYVSQEFTSLNNRTSKLETQTTELDTKIEDTETELNTKIKDTATKLESKIKKSADDVTTEMYTNLKTKADLVEGKVPASQLPSYVDDVIEVDTENKLPRPGDIGKIYVTKDENKTYRWTGTQYTLIGKNLMLDEVANQVADVINESATATKLEYTITNSTTVSDKLVPTTSAVDSMINTKIEDKATELESMIEETANEVTNEFYDALETKADLVEGKVPSSQLPGYVDDVLEYDSYSSLPKPGESGKIYVIKNTNTTYRWSGSQYTEIGKDLALGETSSTAYAGDKGKANADAIAELQTKVESNTQSVEYIKPKVESHDIEIEGLKAGAGQSKPEPGMSYDTALKEASWVRLAKVKDITKNSSGTFIFDCWGKKVNDEGVVIDDLENYPVRQTYQYRFEMQGNAQAILECMQQGLPFELSYKCNGIPGSKPLLNSDAYNGIYMNLSGMTQHIAAGNIFGDTDYEHGIFTSHTLMFYGYPLPDRLIGEPAYKVSITALNGWGGTIVPLYSLYKNGELIYTNNTFVPENEFTEWGPFYGVPLDTLNEGDVISVDFSAHNELYKDTATLVSELRVSMFFDLTRETLAFTGALSGLEGIITDIQTTLPVTKITELGSHKELFTTSVFNVAYGLDDDGKIISDVLPITQAPELSGSSTSGGGSGGGGSGASGAIGVHGLASILIENYEGESYVCGLINFPNTENYLGTLVDMKIDNNLNFEYLDELKVVDLEAKTENGEFQLLEGTQLESDLRYDFVITTTVQNLINSINSIGRFDFKLRDSNNLDYTICFVQSGSPMTIGGVTSNRVPDSVIMAILPMDDKFTEINDPIISIWDAEDYFNGEEKSLYDLLDTKGWTSQPDIVADEAHILSVNLPSLSGTLYICPNDRWSEEAETYVKVTYNGVVTEYNFERAPDSVMLNDLAIPLENITKDNSYITIESNNVTTAIFFKPSDAVIEYTITGFNPLKDFEFKSYSVSADTLDASVFGNNYYKFHKTSDSYDLFSVHNKLESISSDVHKAISTATTIQDLINENLLCYNKQTIHNPSYYIGDNNVPADLLDCIIDTVEEDNTDLYKYNQYNMLTYNGATDYSINLFGHISNTRMERYVNFENVRLVTRDFELVLRGNTISEEMPHYFRVTCNRLQFDTYTFSIKDVLRAVMQLTISGRIPMYDENIYTNILHNAPAQVYVGGINNNTSKCFLVTYDYIYNYSYDENENRRYNKLIAYVVDVADNTTYKWDVEFDDQVYGDYGSIFGWASWGEFPDYTEMSLSNNVLYNNDVSVAELKGPSSDTFVKLFKDVTLNQLKSKGYYEGYKQQYTVRETITGRDYKGTYTLNCEGYRYSNHYVLEITLVDPYESKQYIMKTTSLLAVNEISDTDKNKHLSEVYYNFFYGTIEAVVESYGSGGTAIDTYTKEEADNKFVNKTDTYTKNEADSKFVNKTSTSIEVSKKGEHLSLTPTEIRMYDDSDTSISYVSILPGSIHVGDKNGNYFSVNPSSANIFSGNDDGSYIYIHRDGIDTDECGVTWKDLADRYTNEQINEMFDSKADLDSSGKIPSSQLPSYVDDVIEYNYYSNLPSTGESGKIYITKDDNKTYRWSGSQYTEIGKDLALGETSSTAYAGDKGKANRDDIELLKTEVTALKGSTNNTSSVPYIKISTGGPNETIIRDIVFYFIQNKIYNGLYYVNAGSTYRVIIQGEESQGFLSARVESTIGDDTYITNTLYTSKITTPDIIPLTKIISGYPSVKTISLNTITTDTVNSSNYKTIIGRIFWYIYRNYIMDADTAWLINGGTYLNYKVRGLNALNQVVAYDVSITGVTKYSGTTPNYDGYITIKDTSNNKVHVWHWENVGSGDYLSFTTFELSHQNKLIFSATNGQYMFKMSGTGFDLSYNDKKIFEVDCEEGFCHVSLNELNGTSTTGAILDPHGIDYDGRYINYEDIVETSDIEYTTNLILKNETTIADGDNINLAKYMQVGVYYGNNSNSTIVNCPTANKFRMEVYDITGHNERNPEKQTWVYRVRVITDFNGQQWVQTPHSANTAGSFTNVKWEKKLTDNNFALIPVLTATNTHTITLPSEGIYLITYSEEANEVISNPKTMSSYIISYRPGYTTRSNDDGISVCTCSETGVVSNARVIEADWQVYRLTNTW